MKRNRVSAALAAAAILLSACSAQRPDISLQGVSLGSVGLAGGTLLADVRVHNPNRFTLRANNLRYQLYLRRNATTASDSSWTRLADGVYPDTLTVHAGQTRDFSIPISFSFGDLAGMGSSLLNYGRLDYRALGTVDVHTPIGLRQFPFQRTGTFMMASTH